MRIIKPNSVFRCLLFTSLIIIASDKLICQSLISNMTVYDMENAGDWSVQGNLQVGDKQFGDRNYTIESIPALYLGVNWIQTANDSKSYDGDTLVTFILTDSADVLAALDDRVPLRDWLMDWTDTGHDILNSESIPKTFSLYKKTYHANTIVVLGPTGQTGGANNYVILCQQPQNPSEMPDPFDFSDQFDVPRNGEIVSDAVVITGISESCPVTISGGSYSINNGNFTSEPGTIVNQDKIKTRLISSIEYGQVTTSNIIVGGISAHFSVRTENDPEKGWTDIPEILARINAPVFPHHNIIVTDYGAKGDGITDCTEAFKDAISACHQAGGGRVVVPEGIFITGPIHLQSHVNLYLHKNALVKFSQEYTDYLPVVFTRFEGTECYNYSPPVYAFEQENIAITGQGTLDGQGDNEHWWPWKSTGSADVNQLRQQAEDGVPVEDRIYGEEHYLRPNMIQPYRCKNIFIDSVTILDGPMWHIHPVLCENITITNVHVQGHGPNNDGCNPESCKDVLIQNCFFNTGDDCIAIKSGRNADGRRINVPTENVIIQNCTMQDGHGGVVIGSEISGSARNIFASDCYMDSPNLDRALRIKTNSIRGGIIENIFVKDISVGTVSDAAIRVNFYYGEGDIAQFTPIVRNVEVRSMTCERTNYALRLEGYARSHVRDIRLINCIFNNARGNNILNNIQNIGLDNVSINKEEYHKILEPAGDQSTAVRQQQNTGNLPASIQLMQNHPNPFNSTTMIRYVTHKKEHVNLSLYNLLGQKVTKLVNEIKEAGSHSITLDASNLASGLYIYRLQAGGNVTQRKMILIK